MPVVVLEPNTYYDLTVTCNTSGTEATEETEGTDPCPNFGRVWEAKLVYSNSGEPFVTCGRCSRPVQIMDAVKCDPQPEIS
ncbi:hypothetical protein ACFVYV_25570 [Streptomyces mirabilis]|uniref:hypothetical protein n=1 Tax=Streptomyces mirabilis TaxID=68239 RepID=UPI0036DC00B9